MSGEMPLLDEQSLEKEGVIERVIFHNSENGFTVLLFAPDKGDPETIVGHLANPAAGSRMRFRGRYAKNQRYGRQFKFDVADEVLPSSEEGLQAYLGSGLLKGVGPATAKRIIAAFGLDTVRILDEEPMRLLEVGRIGKKLAASIVKDWNKHRGVRSLIEFLQPHGISTAYALRIHRAYEDAALQIVRENPYRLAMDIHGIGFLTADGIASKLGFGKDHPLRIQAAALYCLQRATEDGNVYLPRELLRQKTCQETGADEDLADSAITALEAAQRLICEKFAEGGEGIYLRRFHHCEARTAYYLSRLLCSPRSVYFKDADTAIAKALAKLSFRLAPAQIAAIEQAAKGKLLVITGGPGTGKTTIINTIIRVYEQANAKILLAAPTGRAAKRMSETSGREARTIHRLLEVSRGEETFGKNENSPLACGLLIIDEASMMDATLFYHLLKATPLGATVILVGDANQLPSVGPGNVLGDIIASGAITVAELTEIFRQAAESEIICNAHLINRGHVPPLEANPDRISDFYFVPRDDPEKAAQLMVELIKNHIPRRFGLDPINEIQLLTPMHKGLIGAANMNSLLQDALNPGQLEIRSGERAFRLHDKVMQIRNNYDKDIYNGDMGRITHLDPGKRELSVDFDGAIVPYEFDELDELVPAYAISIHKSQGSEYPAVVIPVMMQHFVLLQRNLIYTGVTRGKKLVVLVGESRALQIAVKNNKTGKRFTRLAQRLAGYAES